MSVVRVLVVLVCVMSGFQTAAQAQTVGNDQPRLSITMSDPPYIVGQPITLRVKILVPTWMPKPPIYPSFEQPGLMVRLPERSTHPVSETVSGQTWSGTSRRYTLYPLEPLSYQIPGQKISLTYADENAQPVLVDLTTDPIKFRSTLPEGAKDMEPPVMVVTGVSLEQDLSEIRSMAVGDVVTRQVTAWIQGTTAVLIPALIPAPAEVTTDESPADGLLLRAYPKDPVILETETDGVLSGSRREEITYMAQTGGSVVLLPIQVEWFNLATNTIETATLDGKTLQIAAAPTPPIGRQNLIVTVLVLVVSIVFLAWLSRLLWPRTRFKLRTLRDRWHQSEPYARRAVKRAIRSQNQPDLILQLESWRYHYPSLKTKDLHGLDQAMARLGRRIYGPANKGEMPDIGSEWSAIAREFKTLSNMAREQEHLAKAKNVLPSLNP